MSTRADAGASVDLAAAAAVLRELRADDEAAIAAARETVPVLVNGPRGCAAVRALAIIERGRVWGERGAAAAAVVDAVLAAEARPTALVRSLADILADPRALDPPGVVVPRLAWRGRVTLLAAREKIGKSTLAGAAGAHVTRGAAWLGDACEAGDVLIVALEEHVADVAARAQEWGADAYRMYLIDSLATAADPLAALAAAIAELRPALVIVDTLAALVDHLSDRPDPGSSVAWTPIMAALTRIARETDAAVLLLHHARKSDGRYRDSTAIGAGVDAIVEMTDEGQDADVRRLRVRARWRVGDYAVRLVPAGDATARPRYVLSAGEISLDARVLLFVEAHPGCSMRTLRGGVSGRAEDIGAAVARLVARGGLVDRGDAAGMRLHGGGSGSGTTPAVAENPQGTAPEPLPGTAPVPESDPMGGEPGTTPDAPPPDVFS